MSALLKNVQLVRNMGLRYLAFKVGFELKARLGFLKNRFPKDPPVREFISLEKWRKENKFWGIARQNANEILPSTPSDITRLLNGELLFFSAQWIKLGSEYDWVTNPDSGYRYDAEQHWSEVMDFDSKAGDIKYVWEKSRFAYLYDVMRYDLIKGEDHAEWVFNEIYSWLKANKTNSGPNYKCSQEISLRVLNWTYALNFYKNSVHLTEELFREIMNAIYWQLKHVYDNINFSRIAVRNNHAITETLTLYLCALFYPFFPDALKWKIKGKKWFEQEIAYQIYPDGTFLQFSMNYHRVVIQLLTWALKSADFYCERYDEVVYTRAYKSLNFLFTCQDETTGWLPNYGSNDGALFFKLNNCDYRDFRPQLNIIHILLTGKPLYTAGDWNEDVFWFQGQKLKECNFAPLERINGWSTFDSGGYYVLREVETMTFVRCGNHKDRPAQADNLHLDIWYKGQNVLFDGGSYKYNTDPDTLMYFMGTESHNAVMLDSQDQMMKGARFIWYNWTQALKAYTEERNDAYYFEGEISAFRDIKPGIRHNRKIRKLKGRAEWIIEDTVLGKPGMLKMKQYWHPLPQVRLKSKDGLGEIISLQKEKGMKSNYYGVSEDVDQYLAETINATIVTNITIK